MTSHKIASFLKENPKHLELIAKESQMVPDGNKVAENIKKGIDELLITGKSESLIKALEVGEKVMADLKNQLGFNADIKKTTSVSLDKDSPNHSLG